jgi:hypothetical protein
MAKTSHNITVVYTMIKEQGRCLTGANHCVFSPTFDTGCQRFSTVVQPALSYIINPHPSSVFRTPNSHFRKQLTSKHFEISHSGTVELGPELNYESTKYT